MDLEPGTILFGKYRIERVLGKGGMGIVVLAHHLELEDKFAIKVLTGELDADGQQRFLREARAAAQIKSDHIARVIDVGTLPGGKPYMVMEMLEGSDLAGLIDQRGALPIPEAIDVVLQACVGLNEAHAKNFVHRDIKPANLFIQQTNDGRRVVKLLDFGISKQQDVAMTSTRAVLGTPAYMAPEQWRSAKDADARADIWSLGVVLHELLSGHRPFNGDSVPEMCSAVLAEDPPPLTLDHPALAQVVTKCLEKEPADRYQRIPELARALAPFAADPVAANALVDRMDRIAGRPSTPVISTAPTVDARPKAAALADTAIATNKNHTRVIAVGAAAVVAAGAAFALTRSSGDQVVASEPQHGGTLRIGMHRTDESTVALYAGQPTRTQYALRMVLERLIVLDDKDQLRESVLEKALAENNGNDLVLTLRAGVMFHDSPGCMAAAEATAKDLEFSLTEAIAQHQLDLDIESMTANGRELRLHMKSPTLSFAQALSHVWLLPAKLADCDPDRTKLDHLVGSGPFKFAPSQLASALTLVKWEGYWRPNRPRLDRVELVTINDASLALAALHAPVTSTEALHIYIPDVATRRALIKDRTLVGAGTEGLELGTRTHKGDAGTWLLDVTHKPGPLQTVELRRAAAYAIDREAVVKVAAKNAAAPSAPFGGYLQPAALGFDYAAKPFTFDPTRAKELVYNTPGDKAITIGYSFNHDAAKVVADNLTAVGFTVELRKIELRDQSGVLARGEVDAMLISRWGDLVGDELVSIASFDQRRIAGTRALLAKLAGKTKRSERAAGYREIEAALFEHVPSIPIATLDPNQITFAAIVRPQVEGFHDHASGHVPYDDTLTFVETWLNAGVVEGPRVGSAH